MPRGLAPKLKYPAKSLGPPGHGWVQEWHLGSLSRAMEPRDQRWDAPEQLPTAAKGAKEMGARYASQSLLLLTWALYEVNEEETQRGALVLGQGST